MDYSLTAALQKSLTNHAFLVCCHVKPLLCEHVPWAAVWRHKSEDVSLVEHMQNENYCHLKASSHGGRGGGRAQEEDRMLIATDMRLNI